MIALPGACLVVPERPHAAARVLGIDRVGPAVAEDAGIGIAGGGLHQGIVRHRGHRPGILVFGNNVEVTLGPLWAAPSPRVRATGCATVQTRPACSRTLVRAAGCRWADTGLRLWTPRRIAFDEPRLLVFGIAGQSLGVILDSLAVGQDRHAVEALLAVPDCVVTDRFELGSREAFVPWDLISCRQATAGRVSSSHSSSRGRRALTPLMLKLAIRTALGRGARVRCRSWSRSRNPRRRSDSRPGMPRRRDFRHNPRRCPPPVRG